MKLLLLTQNTNKYDFLLRLIRLYDCCSIVLVLLYIIKIEFFWGVQNFCCNTYFDPLGIDAIEFNYMKNHSYNK